jgi:hypothetical protein
MNTKILIIVLFTYFVLFIWGCKPIQNTVNTSFSAQCTSIYNYKNTFLKDTFSIEDYDEKFLTNKFHAINSFFNWSISYSRTDEIRENLVLRLGYEDYTDSLRAGACFDNDYQDSLKFLLLSTVGPSHLGEEKIKQVICEFLSLEVLSISKRDSLSITIIPSKNSPPLIYSVKGKESSYLKKISEHWYIHK